MSSIKIIATPPGQAPKWVRDGWIGVEIPILKQPTGGIQMGVCGGKAENAGGHQVATHEAVEALRKKSPEAADWWKKNFSLASISSLVFSKDVCQVVE